MSDNEKSGEPNSAGADLPAPAQADALVKAEASPAENAGGAVAAAPNSAAPGVGTFGSTRGSGLARGKRHTVAAPAANPAAASTGYKPTSIEVIQPPTEYKNPFTGETTVNVPRTNEPVPPAAPAPESAPTPAPVVEAAQPASTPSPVDASADKPELKILPPEQPKRAAVRWESAGGPGGQGSPAREERPTFRPERERRDNREPRSFDPREPRQPRRDDRRFEQRTPHAQERRPEPQPEKKPAGFVGWLKGLFGGKKEEPAQSPAPEPRREGEFGHRHRHRGGRGRGYGGGFQGENRGPRPEGQQPSGGQPQGGEQRGDGDFGGRRRRRRRGGRGRHRGEPRPEGQQGGGAI